MGTAAGAATTAADEDEDAEDGLERAASLPKAPVPLAQQVEEVLVRCAADGDRTEIAAAELDGAYMLAPRCCYCGVRAAWLLPITQLPGDGPKSHYTTPTIHPETSGKNNEDRSANPFKP